MKHCKICRLHHDFFTNTWLLDGIRLLTGALLLYNGFVLAVNPWLKAFFVVAGCIQFVCVIVQVYVKKSRETMYDTFLHTHFEHSPGDFVKAYHVRAIYKCIYGEDPGPEINDVFHLVLDPVDKDQDKYVDIKIRREALRPK